MGSWGSLLATADSIAVELDADYGVVATYREILSTAYSTDTGIVTDTPSDTAIVTRQVELREQDLQLQDALIEQSLQRHEVRRLALDTVTPKANDLLIIGADTHRIIQAELDKMGALWSLLVTIYKPET